MTDRIQILADIIEPSLSGQYGRDVAEEVALECIQALDMIGPIKWQLGYHPSYQDHINWGDFVYAENAQQAMAILEKRHEHHREWVREGTNGWSDFTLHVRTYPETDDPT